MLRWIVVVLLVLVGVSFYVSRQRGASGPAIEGAAPGQAAGITTAPTVLANGCMPPADIASGDGAVQSPAPGDMGAFRHADATITPLAGFSVDARVLSAKRYGSDREARYAPIDLALGWGRMRDDAVLSQLDISQSGRWYQYRWSNQAPIPKDEIVRSSANMHMIPSNDAVGNALESLEDDDRVRIDGWLVQVEAQDGWRWRSSLTREDQGGGACEVVYVCVVAKR